MRTSPAPGPAGPLVRLARLAAKRERALRVEAAQLSLPVKPEMALAAVRGRWVGAKSVGVKRAEVKAEEVKAGAWRLRPGVTQGAVV